MNGVCFYYKVAELRLQLSNKCSTQNQSQRTVTTKATFIRKQLPINKPKHWCCTSSSGQMRETGCASVAWGCGCDSCPCPCACDSEQNPQQRVRTPATLHMSKEAPNGGAFLAAFTCSSSADALASWQEKHVIVFQECLHIMV